MGGPPAWGLGEVLTTPQCKNLTMLRISQKSLAIGWAFVDAVVSL